MKPSIFISYVHNFFRKRFLSKKKWKTYEAWAERGYINSPKVSFIIQSHNKSAEVKHIVSKLRGCKNAEIIVIDDGSSKRHTKTMVSFLKRGNEFLLRANDLYEVVTYDKAIRMANGEIIALLQDDDDFDDLGWVDKALKHFAQYPDMVILGGKNAIRFHPYDVSADGVVGEYTVDGEMISQKNLFKYDIVGTNGRIHEFQFVQTVNRAPMFICKQLYIEHLKYIDFEYAPFQRDDSELCLRAWVNGLQVGWYEAGFISLTQGGMRIWNKGLGQHQSLVNSKKLYATYGAKLNDINKLVDETNKKR